MSNINNCNDKCYNYYKGIFITESEDAQRNAEFLLNDYFPPSNNARFYGKEKESGENEYEFIEDYKVENSNQNSENNDKDEFEQEKEKNKNSENNAFRRKIIKKNLKMKGKNEKNSSPFQLSTLLPSSSMMTSFLSFKPPFSDVDGNFPAPPLHLFQHIYFLHKTLSAPIIKTIEGLAAYLLVNGDETIYKHVCDIIKGCYQQRYKCIIYCNEHKQGEDDYITENLGLENNTQGNLNQLTDNNLNMGYVTYSDLSDMYRNWHSRVFSIIDSGEYSVNSPSFMLPSSDKSLHPSQPWIIYWALHATDLLGFLPTIKLRNTTRGDKNVGKNDCSGENDLINLYENKLKQKINGIYRNKITLPMLAVPRKQLRQILLNLFVIDEIATEMYKTRMKRRRRLEIEKKMEMEKYNTLNNFKSRTDESLGNKEWHKNIYQDPIDLVKDKDYDNDLNGRVKEEKDDDDERTYVCMGFAGGDEQMPHLAPTYASILALSILEEEDDEEDAEVLNEAEYNGGEGDEWEKEEEKRDLEDFQVLPPQDLSSDLSSLHHFYSTFFDKLAIKNRRQTKCFKNTDDRVNRRKNIGKMKLKDRREENVRIKRHSINRRAISNWFSTLAYREVDSTLCEGGFRMHTAGETDLRATYIVACVCSILAFPKEWTSEYLDFIDINKTDTKTLPTGEGKAGLVDKKELYGEVISKLQGKNAVNPEAFNSLKGDNKSVEPFNSITPTSTSASFSSSSSSSKVLNFIMKSQRFDGSFSCAPLSPEGHGGYTQPALSALLLWNEQVQISEDGNIKGIKSCIKPTSTTTSSSISSSSNSNRNDICGSEKSCHGVGVFDDSKGVYRLLFPRQFDLHNLRRWLANRQHAACSNKGGNSGRTNKLVDSCYSWWIGSGMALVEALGSQNRRISHNNRLLVEKSVEKGKKNESVEGDGVVNLLKKLNSEDEDVYNNSDNKEVNSNSTVGEDNDDTYSIIDALLLRQSGLLTQNKEHRTKRRPSKDFNENNADNLTKNKQISLTSAALVENDFFTSGNSYDLNCEINSVGTRDGIGVENSYFVVKMREMAKQVDVVEQFLQVKDSYCNYDYLDKNKSENDNIGDLDNNKKEKNDNGLEHNEYLKIMNEYYGIVDSKDIVIKYDDGDSTPRFNYNKNNKKKNNIYIDDNISDDDYYNTFENKKKWNNNNKNENLHLHKMIGSYLDDGAGFLSCINQRRLQNYVLKYCQSHPSSKLHEPREKNEEVTERNNKKDDSETGKRVDNINDCLNQEYEEGGDDYDYGISDIPPPLIYDTRSTSNGGLMDKPTYPRDYYHTCYALSGVSITQQSGLYFETVNNFGNSISTNNDDRGDNEAIYINSDVLIKYLQDNEMLPLPISTFTEKFENDIKTDHNDKNDDEIDDKGIGKNSDINKDIDKIKFSGRPCITVNPFYYLTRKKTFPFSIKEKPFQLNYHYYDITNDNNNKNRYNIDAIDTPVVLGKYDEEFVNQRRIDIGNNGKYLSYNDYCDKYLSNSSVLRAVHPIYNICLQRAINMSVISNSLNNKVVKEKINKF